MGSSICTYIEGKWNYPQPKPAHECLMITACMYGRYGAEQSLYWRGNQSIQLLINTTKKFALRWPDAFVRYSDSCLEFVHVVVCVCVSWQTIGMGPDPVVVVLL